MNTKSLESGTERNPWSGIGLTIILPGLGQIYCGALLRGLIFMALSILVGIFMVILGDPAGVNASGWFGMFCLGGLVVMLVAMVDTWRLARRTRADYRLKDFNRWQVYVLLLIISSGGGIGYALYVRESMMQAFKIPNNSMYPTIRQGDQIVATKNDFLERDPERGEVVIFRNPEKRKQYWVKRVVAVAGDTVEVRAGVLYVNGEKQSIEMTGEETLRWKGKDHAGVLVREGTVERSYEVFQLADSKGAAAGDIEPVEVMKNHVYVLGDHRANSRDSRHLGPIPVASVVGRVGWIVFPGEDWSRIGKLE